MIKIAKTNHKDNIYPLNACKTGQMWQENRQSGSTDRGSIAYKSRMRETGITVFITWYIRIIRIFFVEEPLYLKWRPGAVTFTTTPLCSDMLGLLLF